MTVSDMFLMFLFAFSVLVPAADGSAKFTGDDFGSFEEVTQQFKGRNLTVTARIRGLGPTHEITGSFQGGKRYFNSDGVFSSTGQMLCSGFRYDVHSRRGTSTIVVTMPRVCVKEDAGRGVRVNLLMLDSDEPGRSIYLRIDSVWVPTAANCHPRSFCHP